MSVIIFITGGGISSLGKGIVASSLGALLRCQGRPVPIDLMMFNQRGV